MLRQISWRGRGQGRAQPPVPGRLTRFPLDWTYYQPVAATRSAERGLVSCLCVTRGRAIHVRRALACFFAQTYPRLELVLVCEELEVEAEALLAVAGDRVRVVRVPSEPKQVIGALRNIGLAAARGDYVCVWDDDDWHAPRRVELQVEHLRATSAAVCLLARIVVLDQRSGRACVTSYRPWEPTLLFRRSLEGAASGFPEIAQNEDTPFVKHLQRLHGASLLERPELYLYLFHGANNCSAAHFADIFRHGVALDTAQRERFAALTQELSLE